MLQCGRMSRLIRAIAAAPAPVSLAAPARLSIASRVVQTRIIARQQPQRVITTNGANNFHTQCRARQQHDAPSSSRTLSLVQCRALHTSRAMRSRNSSPEADSPSERHLATAMLKAQRGDTEGALAEYQLAIELDPADIRGWGCRAELHESQGRPDRALSDYRQCTLIVPQHLPSYAGMARCYAQLGNYAKAIRFFDQVIVAEPKFPQALLGRAECHLSLGDRTRAEADIAEAYRLMPHDSSVVVAFARFNAGKSPDTTRTALKSLEEVLAKDPTKLSAYVVASMLYSELEMDEEAGQVLTKGIEAAKEVHGAESALLDLVRSRATIRAAQLRWEETETDANWAIELLEKSGNKDLRMFLLLGQSLWAQQKWLDAISAFDEAIFMYQEEPQEVSVSQMGRVYISKAIAQHQVFLEGMQKIAPSLDFSQLDELPENFGGSEDFKSVLVGVEELLFQQPITFPRNILFTATTTCTEAMELLENTLEQDDDTQMLLDEVSSVFVTVIRTANHMVHNFSPGDGAQDSTSKKTTDE